MVVTPGWPVCKVLAGRSVSNASAKKMERVNQRGSSEVRNRPRPKIRGSKATTNKAMLRPAWEEKEYWVEVLAVGVFIVSRQSPGYLNWMGGSLSEIGKVAITAPSLN